MAAKGQRSVIVGPGRPGRPPYPKWPLDPDCLEPGEPRRDVVALVRLVVTDFDPETDPTGWDSVADLVRGDGRPWDEVRQMNYHDLAAFFRNRHGRLKFQLGGTIETNTPSIVSYNAAPTPETAPKPRGESAAERLRKLWTTAEGRRKIMDAGSAERIAILIGVGKTSVVDAGSIWDRDIGPALKAQRSMVRYHRDERDRGGEGLDG